MSDARVVLWGRDIGAVSWLDEQGMAVFQYSPEFVGSGIQVAPLTMPLQEEPYQFPALPRSSFRGLPGLLADSLPDKFGNALIDAWLASQSRSPESFNPVERLCYIGSRGMGALEFRPSLGERPTQHKRVEIEALVNLANQVLDARAALSGRLAGEDDGEALEDIIRVGSSPGGARAKAILAWNPDSGEFRSGQLPADAGYSYWLLKFDGVSNNRDREVADPQGYGLIEFAYYLMATAAGIHMMESRLHQEGGRAHFMTRRFDRDDGGEKIHMQSLGAMAHFDYNLPGAYSYEQAMQSLKRLGAPMADLEELLRRAVFNVMARNQDDHVKNISFLMDKSGTWRLSPAYDVIYAYNPTGDFTARHQMSINGKRDDFSRDDLIALAQAGNIKARKAMEIMADVARAIARWKEFARQAGVAPNVAQSINAVLRTLG